MSSMAVPAYIKAIEVDGLRVEFKDPITAEDAHEWIAKYRRAAVAVEKHAPVPIVVNPAPVVIGPSWPVGVPYWSPYQYPQVWCETTTSIQS